METYAAGEILMIFPKACLYLECIYFDPGDIEGEPGGPGEGHYVKVTILDNNDCDECCVHDGKLYGPGQWVHKSHDDCIRSTCTNGTWVDKDETDTCCVYSDGFDDKFYVDGETIKIDDCLRIWCNASVVVEEDYECCCETDDGIYECGEFLPNPWGCIFEQCVDGSIVYVLKEGCCEHYGVTYMNGEIVSSGDDPCNYMRCVNGTVRMEHNDDCCRYDCGWVAPGTLVEEDAHKCILKICENSQIKDYSFPDECNCCIYDGVLYPNGGMLTNSLCITILCSNGTWIQENTFACKHCIIRDDPHFKTFKDTWYTFHTHCCNTLIQRKEFAYSTINHVWGCFGNCPPKFFRPGPSCIHDIRIQHDMNTSVVITVSGDILVNEVLVNGFLGLNGLFIFRKQLAIIAVTFDGVVVEVHTNYPMRAVRIWVPPELVGEYFGLCGVYNDLPTPDVFRLRKTDVVTEDVYDFGNSWKYPEDSTCPDSEYVDTCEHVPDIELEQIKERCRTMLNNSAECDYVSENMDDHMQTCTSDMCACAESAFDECIEAIGALFSEECEAMNMTIPPTPPPDCPTPPPCLCGPEEFSVFPQSANGSEEFSVSRQGSNAIPTPIQSNPAYEIATNVLNPETRTINDSTFSTTQIP